jgi:hypothetical protein
MSPVTRDSFPDPTISELHAANRSDKEDNVNVETKVDEQEKKKERTRESADTHAGGSPLSNDQRRVNRKAPRPKES